MNILPRSNFFERNAVCCLILQLVKCSVFASTDSMTCSTNNTITPWVNLSYGFSSLNSEINGVEIEISFSAIATTNVNYTSLCIIISKESESTLKKILRNRLEDLPVQAQKFPNKSIFVKNCTLDMNYRTLPNQHIYHINVEINSTDNLNLVITSKFQNVTKCSIYEIKRPDFEWCRDLLKAGGLVLLFLCPTIIYVIYRFAWESYVGRVRVKQMKKRNRNFHLYVLPEETIELEGI